MILHRRLIAATVSSVLLLGSLAEARASGFSVLTFGTRRTGSVANLAKPDDATAVFHNPAGLGDQTGVQLFAFFAFGFTRLEARLGALDPVRFPAINPDNCGVGARPPCPWPIDGQGYYRRTISPEKYFGVMPFLGVSTDLGFIHKKMKSVVASLAVFAPNFYGAFLPDDAPSAYHIVSGVFLVGSVTFGLGWRINRHISIGADVSYTPMYLSMKQKFSLADALTPQGQQPDATATMAQDIIGDIFMRYTGFDHGVGWGVGLLISPTRWFHIGLRYTGSTQARFEGDVTFSALPETQIDRETFQTLVAMVGYKLPRRLIVEMAIPHSVQLGLAFDIGWRVELALDLRVWFYNFYERQVIEPLYDPDEEGEEPLTKEGLTRDKNYDLSFQITGGILVRPSAKVRGLELLFGTGYVHSPVPDETFSLDNPLLAHFKVTAGVRWKINRHWMLGVAYQCNIYLPLDVVRSQTAPPTNVQGSAIAHVPALEMTYRF